MSEQHDTTNWGGLQHAYGTAEDLPATIRELASANENQRRNALVRLANAVVHQGTRYIASAAVVPPVLDLVIAIAVYRWFANPEIFVVKKSDIMTGIYEFATMPSKEITP